MVAVVSELIGADSDELTIQIIENDKRLAALREYAQTAWILNPKLELLLRYVVWESMDPAFAPYTWRQSNNAAAKQIFLITLLFDLGVGKDSASESHENLFSNGRVQPILYKFR